MRGISLLGIRLANLGANVASGLISRAIAELSDLPGPIAQSGLEAERLKRRFQFAARGIAAGARESRFAREEADRLGIDFLAASEAYSGLAAALRTRLGA